MSTVEGEASEHGSAGDEGHDTLSRSESIENEPVEKSSTTGSDDAELSAPVDTTKSNPAELTSDHGPEQSVSSSKDSTDGGEVSVLEPREESEDSPSSSPATVVDIGALEHDSDETSDSGTASTEDGPPKAEIPVQVAGRRDPVTQEDMERAIKNAQENKDNEDKTHLRYPENVYMIPEEDIFPRGRRCLGPDEWDFGVQPPLILNTSGEGSDEQPLAEAVETRLPSSAASDYPDAEYGDYSEDNNENNSKNNGRPQTPSGLADDTNLADPFSDLTFVAAAGNEIQENAVPEPYPRPVSRVGSVRSHFSSSSEEEGKQDGEERDGQDEEEGKQEETKGSEPDQNSWYYSKKKGWINASEASLKHMLEDISGRGRPLGENPPAPRRSSPLSSEIGTLDVPDLDQGPAATETPDPDQEPAATETDQPRTEASEALDSDQGSVATETDQPEPTINSPRGLGRRISQRNLKLARQRLNETGIVGLLLDPKKNKGYPVWTDEGELQDIFDKCLSNGRYLLAESHKELEKLKDIFPLHAALEVEKKKLDQKLCEVTAEKKKLDQRLNEETAEWNQLVEDTTMIKERSRLLEQDVEKLELELESAREACQILRNQNSVAYDAAPAQCSNCPRLQKEIDRLGTELLLLKSTAKSAPEGHEDRSNKLAEDIKQLQEDLARERTISTELKDQQTFSLALSTFQKDVQWPREKQGAVAAIIVDYINGENKNRAEPLRVEEVLYVLEQNNDIQAIASWLDRHSNRYRFKPNRLFQSILFSGEVFNLGLVTAFLSISGFMGEGIESKAHLSDYINLFQKLRDEWTTKFSNIRETLDNAESERTALSIQLLDEKEANDRLLMEATSRDKSAKADSNAVKELAKAEKDLLDKAKELEGCEDVINSMSEQQEQDNAKIAKLKAEVNKLESKVERLTKDLKDKDNQATRQVGTAGTTDLENEERIKQLGDEAQRLQNIIEELNAQAEESDTLREELQALKDSSDNISAQAAETDGLRKEVEKLQKQNADLNARVQRDAKLIHEMDEGEHLPKVQQDSEGSASEDPADQECPRRLARLKQDFEDYKASAKNDLEDLTNSNATARKEHEKQVKDLHEELDREKREADKKRELSEKWRTEKVDLETAHSKCAAQIADLEAKIFELDAQRGRSSENTSSASERTADGLAEKRLEEVQLDLSQAHSEMRGLRTQIDQANMKIKDLEAQNNNHEQQENQSNSGRAEDTNKQIEQYQQQISDLQTIKDEHLKCPIIIAELQNRIVVLEAIEAENRRCSARVHDLENNIRKLEQERQRSTNDSESIASGLVDAQIQALQRQLRVAHEDENKAQAARASQDLRDKDNAKKLQDEIDRLASEAQIPQSHNLVSALNKITKLHDELATANGEKDIMNQMLRSAGGVQEALSGRIADLEATNRDLQATLESTSTGPTNTTVVPPANITSALQRIAELESKLASSSGEKDSLLKMVNIATADKKALEEQVSDLEATNQTFRSNAPAATAPANIVSALQKIAELESKLASSSGEKDSLLQMVNIATADKKALQEQVDDLEATNQDPTFNNTTTTDQNTRDQEMQKLKDDHKAEIQHLIDTHDEEKQRLLDGRNPNDQPDADQDSSRTIKNLKSQNGRLNDENQGLHTEDARLEDEKKQLNADNTRLEDEIKRLNTTISVKPNESVNDLKTQIKNQATELARFDRFNKEMRDQLEGSRVGSDELIALRNQVASLTLSVVDAEQQASQVGPLNDHIRDLGAENQDLQSRLDTNPASTSTLPDPGLRLKLRQENSRLQREVKFETALSRQLQAHVADLEAENKALENWSGVAINEALPLSFPSPEASLRLRLSREIVQLRKQIRDLEVENKVVKDRPDAAKNTSKAEQINPFWTYPIDVDAGPHLVNIRARTVELEAATNDFNKQLDRDSGEPHIVNEFRNFRLRMQIEILKSQSALLMALLRSATGVAEQDDEDEYVRPLSDKNKKSENKGNAETEGSEEAEGSDETEGSGEAKGSDETDDSGGPGGSAETEGSGEADDSAETGSNKQSDGSGETGSSESESELAKENAVLRERAKDLHYQMNATLELIPIAFDEFVPVLRDESEDNLARQTVDVYKKQADQCKLYYSGLEGRNRRAYLEFLMLQHDMWELENAHELAMSQADATIADLQAQVDGTSKPAGTSNGKKKAKDTSTTEDVPEEEWPDSCEMKLASANRSISELKAQLGVTATRIQSLGRERDNLLRLGGDKVRNSLANAKGGMASSSIPANKDHVPATSADDMTDEEQLDTCEKKLARARSIAKNLRIQLRKAQSQIRLLERGNTNLLRIGGDSLRNALAAEKGQSRKADGTEGDGKAKNTINAEGTPEEGETDTCERKLAFARATITDLRAQLKDAQARADDNIHLQEQLDRAKRTIAMLQKEMAATGDPEKSHIATDLAMANQARDELHEARNQIHVERTTIAGMHYDRSQLELKHEQELSELVARIAQLEHENAKLRRIGSEIVKNAVGATAATIGVTAGAAALNSAFGRLSTRRFTTTTNPPTRIPVPTSTTPPPPTTTKTPRPSPSCSTTQSYLPLTHRFQIRPINYNNQARQQALFELDKKAAEMRRRHASEADRQQKIDDYLLETWGVGPWASREAVWAHVFEDQSRNAVVSTEPVYELMA